MQIAIKTLITLFNRLIKHISKMLFFLLFLVQRNIFLLTFAPLQKHKFYLL